MAAGRWVDETSKTSPTFPLLPLAGEGARRADEGVGWSCEDLAMTERLLEQGSRCQTPIAPRQPPSSGLSATFSREREKGKTSSSRTVAPVSPCPLPRPLHVAGDEVARLVEELLHRAPGALRV